MSSLIKIHCYSPKISNQKWPDLFPEVPKVGDIVESESGIEAKVKSIKFRPVLEKNFRCEIWVLLE